jgi:hypothetical protein
MSRGGGSAVIELDIPASRALYFHLGQPSQDVSGDVLAEAVAEKAGSLRAVKPRLGVAGSTDGRAAADLANDPPPYPDPGR